MHTTVAPAAPAAAWPLGRTAVTAALGSAVLNALVFGTSVALGIFPGGAWFAASPDDPMTLGPILLVSVVGAAAGVGVFALLRTRLGDPMRVFTVLAISVLLLSFVAPFAMPGWTLAQAVALNLMHSVVAGATLWSVSRVAAPGGR